MRFLVDAQLQGPVVVWVRVGNTRHDVFLAWFEPLIDRVVDLVPAGETLIDLR